MQKLYIILFCLLKVSSLVSAVYVNCFSEKVTDSYTGGIEMNLLTTHDELHELRKQMIKEIEADISETSDFTGINHLSAKVLNALERVPRHLFVLPADEKHAYLNTPLPIGEGQTISQPFIVALMTELLDLKPDDKVLEIGTGSGYQAAILALLAKEVYTIETIHFLAQAAQKRLNKLGYNNVHVLKDGSGRQGWVEHSPYDKIIVTAASPDIPSELLDQLSNNGIMVIPLGEQNGSQFLTIVRKDEKGNVTQQAFLPVRFVPFT